MAQKKKAGTAERRAARRQAVADQRAAWQAELEARAELRRAMPRPKILEFVCRHNVFRIDFTNSITIPFDMDKDSVDDVPLRVAEQLRLMKEAEESEPN